jgi:hypothetical protein
VCGDMERGGTVDLLYLFAPHVRSSATPWIFCASAAAVHGATCAVLLFAGFDFTDQLCRSDWIYCAPDAFHETSRHNTALAFLLGYTYFRLHQIFFVAASVQFF